LRTRLLELFPALAKLPPRCYVVGGAIRDLVIGRTPADADVASVDAHRAAQALGRKVIRLGREQLSAYRVVDGPHVYDFAELEGGDVAVDLARRDFTMNAMALDWDRDALLDPHGGQRDAQAGVVRMVRASNFDDDPLRTLKGVRMAVKYGFTIDGATLAAIRERAGKIREVAPERVTYELSVIFSSGAFRRAMALLEETGLGAVLGLTPRNGSDELSLAAALARIVDDPRAYAERWRWSESLLRDVLTLQRLVASHDRVALYDAGEPVARQLPPLLPDETLDWPDFSIKPLLSSEEIGVPPGPELGRVKRALLEAQIRGQVRTREEARAYLSAVTLPR
jgi:tRNA nucleotidyltransferase/poly(A) polymerase